MNLFGPKGIGKSLVGRIVGYYTHQKNLFKDGIYYFDLKSLLQSHSNNLKDIMQCELGDELFSKEIHYYFRNKQICLIFDDFDLLLRNDVDYFEHIFTSIKECMIPFIAITQEELKRYPIQNKVQLNSLNTDDSRILADYYIQTQNKL